MKSDVIKLYKESTKSKAFFLLLTIGMEVFFLFLRDFLGINIPVETFLIAPTIITLTGNESDIVSFCVCLIPMLNALQSKYAMLICMIGYLLRFSNRKIKLQFSIVVPLIILILWEILHFQYTFSLIEIFRLFTELLFCCFVVSQPIDRLNLTKIIRVYSITTVVICFLILLIQLKPFSYNLNLLFTGVYRFGYSTNESVMAVGFNPNILGLICLMGIMSEWLIVNKCGGSLFDYLCIIMLFFFGILTLSKKFIICILFFFILVGLCSKEKYNEKLKLIIIVISILLITYFIVSKFFPNAINFFINRFNEEDITTGRMDIFTNYVKIIDENIDILLFGVGWQNYALKLIQRFSAGIPHNGEQELIAMWGIFGLIIFLMFIYNIVKHAKRCNTKIQFYNYVPLIVFLVFVQGAQWVSSSVNNMVIIIIYLCLLLVPTNKDN